MTTQRVRILTFEQFCRTVIIARAQQLDELFNYPTPPVKEVLLENLRRCLLVALTNFQSVLIYDVWLPVATGSTSTPKPTTHRLLVRAVWDRTLKAALTPISLVFGSKKLQDFLITCPLILEEDLRCWPELEKLWRVYDKEG